MLKTKVDKAFSILERINQDNEKEKNKQEKAMINQKNTKKDTKKDNKLTNNNQLNKNQINDTKLQEIISNPEFYIQLMRNKIPIAVIAHNENYFKWTDLYKSQNIITLYEKYKNNDELQTARFNEVNWKLFKLDSNYNVEELKV